MNATAAPHTILLVEDEAIIALAEAAALKRHGYRVVTVNNGLDAIAKAEQDPDLDLILMDIDLGRGMDGTEAARAILQHRDLPVVFLSSHTERDVVEKTEEITSYGYVVKNSGETVLVASIKMAYKLFESEQRYRFLFEQSPLAIIHFDDQGIIRDCNETYEKYTGIKRGTIIGLNLFDLPDKNMVAEVEKALRGETAPFEGPYETAIARRSLWIRGFFAPFRRTGPGPVGGMGIFEEITEYHQAELAREQGLQQFKSLIDNLQGGVLVESRDRVITHANPAFCRIFGIPSPDSLIGVACEAAAQGVSALFVDPPGFIEEIRAILSQCTLVSGQRLHLKDGRVLERDYVPVAIRDSFTGNMWIYRDITLQENALRQKERNADLLGSIFNGISDPLHLIDKDYRIVMTNIAFLALVDRQPEDFVGHPCYGTLQTNNRPCPDCRVAEVLATGCPVFYRLHKTLPGGEPKTYQVSAFPILEQGTVEQVLIHTRDISEQVRAEFALKAIHQELERSEDHYRTLIENLPGIVYLFSSKRGGLFWSPQVESILGYSIAHLRDHPFLWNESIHPDDREPVSRAIASSADTDFAIEYRIRDVQGRWRLFLDRSIERRRDGDEVIIQGLAIDLTDRRGTPRNPRKMTPDFI